MDRQAFEALRKKEKVLKKAAEVLRVNPEDLPRVIKRFKQEIEEMEKMIKEKV